MVDLAEIRKRARRVEAEAAPAPPKKAKSGARRASAKVRPPAAEATVEPERESAPARSRSEQTRPAKRTAPPDDPATRRRAAGLPRTEPSVTREKPAAAPPPPSPAPEPAPHASTVQAPPPTPSAVEEAAPVVRETPREMLRDTSRETPRNTPREAEAPKRDSPVAGPPKREDAAPPLPPTESGETAETASDESRLLELLTFSLGDEEYAIPIERIVEIVPYRSTTPVPTSDAAIIGILSLRGVVVTILDFRERLGSRRIEPTAETRFVVLDLERETVGILVDRVRRVVRFASDDVEPPPRIDVGEGSDLISGVVERAGKIVVLLDLDRLLGATVETEEA